MAEETQKKEHNKYERVILAAMRARELSDGIGVQGDMEGKKITTIAMQELNNGQLQFSDEVDTVEKTQEASEEKVEVKVEVEEKAEESE